MRRTDSIASLLAIAGIALLLGGCRQQTELPDLSGLGAITTISREDGSGTKAEFENLIHLQQNASDTEADSTENVINQISASKGAIGYAAFSSVKDIKKRRFFPWREFSRQQTRSKTEPIRCAGSIYWLTPVS
ncbi:hypothetical protein [Candidatus Ventrimonas sp.]|uniref:hypothetical protein n=1 Tax=Candidatus Ventrimonas sp. TaxID=3048889 RepID=UPI003AB2A4F3